MPTFTDPSKSTSPANSEPNPVQDSNPAETVKPSTDPSEMQIVPAPNFEPLAEPEFELPDGWAVEVRPRGTLSSTGPIADKLYYEPGTGRKFRSLVSVKRHLAGEDVYTPKKMKVNRDPQKMQIVSANSSNRSTELPDGWVVKVCPRGPNSTVHADKYYYEPGTGRKFRSLISVKRHLSGEEEQPRTARQKPSNTSMVLYQNSDTVRRVVYHGKVLTQDEMEEARHMKMEDIHPKTSQFNSSQTLPDGWIVDEVPRNDGLRSDRYYIDPVSGKRFRSILEVHRFLEDQNYKPRSKGLTLKSNYSTAARSSLPRKKNTSIKLFKDTMFDLTCPPKKINWVYSGDGKDDWSPLVEECVLPNYVKEQWSETFLLGMNGAKQHPLQLTMQNKMHREDNFPSCKIHMDDFP